MRTWPSSSTPPLPVSNPSSQPPAPASLNPPRTRLLLPAWDERLTHHRHRSPGNKIEAIENLGATEDQFDTIDLSDNGVLRLDGFPHLARLKTLLLSGNAIRRFGKGLEGALPNLENLVLTDNKVQRLEELQLLTGLKRLQRLSLLHNPVAGHPKYRLYAIRQVPGLKMLDFQKVTRAERDAAAGLELDSCGKLVGAGGRLAGGEGEVPEKGRPKSRCAPSPAELTQIKAAIAGAQTLEDVAKLEEALKGGQGSDDMEEG